MIKNIIFLGLIILLMVRCGDQIEGCLNPAATNFAADADIDCCCEYPELIVKLSHKAGEDNFNYNTLYKDAMDSVYSIEKMRFYISDVSLVRDDGTLVTVTDTMTITMLDVNNNYFTTEVSDNFQLVDKDLFSLSMGNIKTTGDFTKIRFNVGISQPTNYALIDNMPEAHPLAAQTDSMYYNNVDGYIFNKINVQTDTANNTIKVFEIAGNVNLVPIELDYATTVSAGNDITLKLKIDYLKFFENVAFQQDDEITIKQKVVTNTSNVFSIEE